MFSEKSAGNSGRKVLEKVIKGSAAHLEKDGILLLEMGSDQQEFIHEAGEKNGFGRGRQEI